MIDLKIKVPLISKQIKTFKIRKKKISVCPYYLSKKSIKNFTESWSSIGCKSLIFGSSKYGILIQRKSNLRMESDICNVEMVSLRLLATYIASVVRHK